MSFVVTLALLASQTGTLRGHVTLGPLTRAERHAQHTHFDKAESIAGFNVEIYPIVHGKQSDQPAAEIVLKEDGNFTQPLAPGVYEVTMSRDMHAGAYSVYPTQRARIRYGRTTRIILHLRSEYFN